MAFVSGKSQTRRRRFSGFDSDPAMTAKRRRRDCYVQRNNSGSLAKLAAMRRASSLVSILATDRRPGSWPGRAPSSETAAPVYAQRKQCSRGVVLRATADRRLTLFVQRSQQELGTPQLAPRLRKKVPRPRIYFV
jgi:hypothetical protein